VRLRHLSLVAIVGFIANPLAAQLRLEPFDIRVPSAPAAFPADGKTNFTYELRITNIDRREVKITGIEVIADSTGPSLQSLDSTALKAATRLAGAPVTGGDSRTLPSGRQTLLYLWVTLPEGGSTPSRLRHRISYATVDSASNPVNDVVEAFYVPVRNLTLATIVAPFGGGGGPWVAVNGPSNTSGHRRTAVPIGGEAQIGQRFATDWIKLGPDGLAFKGDSLVNANWYGYGTPVVAVADGIVTETKDGIIENVPFSPKMAVPITLETVGGNHVILDVGGGYYAFYAHLVPSSVKVKVGIASRRDSRSACSAIRATPLHRISTFTWATRPRLLAPKDCRSCGTSSSCSTGRRAASAKCSRAGRLRPRRWSIGRKSSWRT
jgi:hypothetical protein